MVWWWQGQSNRRQQHRQACVQGTARTLFCCFIAIGTLAWLLVMDLAISLAGHPLSLAVLIPVTILAGLTFGASWTLMSVTTSELFGLRHFSKNYAAVQLAPILATLLGPQLVGNLFDAAARAQHPGSTRRDLLCQGAQCFLPSFCTLTVLAMLVCAV